jgi:hypothetical protein
VADGIPFTRLFQPPHEGRARVREYVVGAFAGESAVAEVRFGTPGRRRGPRLGGVLGHPGRSRRWPGHAGWQRVARFDADGLITEARDYWHETAGHIPPQDEWGRA